MRRYKISVIILTLVIIIIFGANACKTNKNYNNDFIEGFELKFIDHFPKDVPNSTDSEGYRTLIPKNNKYATDIGRLYLKIKNDNSLITDSLLEYYVNNSLASYTSEDTNCFIPLKFKDSIHTIEFNKTELYKIYNENKFGIDLVVQPLPNFSYVGMFDKSNSTSTGLPSDFSIFVIESKRGEFWEDSTYYMENSLMYFPEKWKHGMSKGVAISETSNEIIYWVIYW